MTLNTRLTEFFGIEHPILLAPMAGISGGRLAAAVTAAVIVFIRQMSSTERGETIVFYFMLVSAVTGAC